jgi:hypothetical protein
MATEKLFKRDESLQCIAHGTKDRLKMNRRDMAINMLPQQRLMRPMIE